MEVTIMRLGLSWRYAQEDVRGGCPFRVALRLCVSASLPVGLLRSAARRRLRQPEVPKRTRQCKAINFKGVHRGYFWIMENEMETTI